MMPSGSDKPGTTLRSIQPSATTHFCMLCMQINANAQSINRSVSTCHLSAVRSSGTGTSRRRTGQWCAVKRRTTSDGTAVPLPICYLIKKARPVADSSVRGPKPTQVTTTNITHKNIDLL